jgi:hypothetical protein
MSDKVKITFVLPTMLQNELKERLVQDKYDMKSKSRWVSEAINGLLRTRSFPDLVKLSDEMNRFEKLESVVITRDLKKQLDNAVIDVRKKYPALEGVQSRIVRTAIVQRLLQKLSHLTFT